MAQTCIPLRQQAASTNSSIFNIESLNSFILSKGPAVKELFAKLIDVKLPEENIATSNSLSSFILESPELQIFTEM